MSAEKYEERQLVEFANEGNKIFGIIHRPIGKINPPFVIFCHGLAGHRIGKNRMYVQLSECLSKAGIASFRFDFRGSGDSEGEFGEMSLKGEVSDAIKAIEFILQQPNLDTDRFGIFGRSFGGAIAIYAAAKFKNLKSMVLWAPVFSGEQWQEKWEMVQTRQIDEEARRNLMRINGQLPSLDFYQELFSMNLKEEFEKFSDVPLLLIHGKNDPVVGIQHSDKIMELRKGVSEETLFLRLEHSDHDFTHPEEKNYAIDQTTQWFVKTLLEKKS